MVKQALVTAQNDKRYLDLRKSTHGLVFFAVPHQGGSGATLGMIAKRLVLALNGDANNSIVESLRSNSLFQENQAVFFKHQLEDYHIVSVYENRPTKLKGFFGKASALVFPLPLSHPANKICRLLSTKSLRLSDYRALGRSH